jgi:hypothetical protein
MPDPGTPTKIENPITAAARALTAGGEAVGRKPSSAADTAEGVGSAITTIAPAALAVGALAAWAKIGNARGSAPEQSKGPAPSRDTGPEL